MTDQRVCLALLAVAKLVTVLDAKHVLQITTWTAAMSARSARPTLVTLVTRMGAWIVIRIHILTTTQIVLCVLRITV